MEFSTADTKLGPWVTPWWVSVGGLVILATVLAYVSGIMAARALGSKVASFMSLTEVLFAVIWAWLLLGELPGVIQLLGGALIVGGVILVRLDELRPSRTAARIRAAGETAGAVKAASETAGAVKAASPLAHANDVEPVP
jgi:drug/metabolite transporter (DMT)-like permease